MKAAFAAVVLAALASVAAAVWVGVRTFDGTVTPAPYEAGIRWDEAQRARAALGWTVRIPPAGLRVGESPLEVLVADRAERPVAGARVRLALGRPGDAAHDRAYEAAPDGDGRYRARVDLPLFGFWDVHVDVERGAQAASWDLRIYVPR